MSEQGPDPKTTALAAKLLESMLADAGTDDLCPHCVGLELIYLVAKEMTVNTDVDPGELFNAVHMGIGDGEAEPAPDPDAEDSAPEGGGPNWTLH
jgi:hypothetical protein